MYGVDQAEASIVGSVLVFIAAMAGLYVQNRRNTKAQRADHAATADMVREMRDDVRDIKAEVREVKEEVREVKGDVRSHGEQIANARKANESTIAELDDLKRVVHDLRKPNLKESA